MVAATHAAIVLLMSLAVLQGIATPLIDFNRTHATNPRWTGHARFHLVWQNLNTSMFAAVEVTLLLWTGPHLKERFYLAALMASVPSLGFLAAQMLRGLYGGTLYDENGIPPARVRLGGRLLKVDLNTVVVVAAVAFLLAIVFLFYQSMQAIQA